MSIEIGKITFAELKSVVMANLKKAFLFPNTLFGVTQDLTIDQ